MSYAAVLCRQREKKEGTQGDRTEPPPFRARRYALILAFIVLVSIADVNRPVDRLKEQKQMHLNFHFFGCNLKRPALY